MAGTRRTAKGLAPIPRAYIEKLIKKTPELRVKALVALLYLTGKRIGELLPTQPSDYKRRKYLRREMLYVHVQLEKKGTVRHPTEKHPHPKLRPPQFADIPIIMRDPFTKHILNWLDFRKEHPHRHLFGFGTRQRAWQILTTLDKDIWVHWFRHMRFSHLSETMNPYELKDFADFETLEPAVSYVHTKNVVNKIELADKLQRGIK